MDTPLSPSQEALRGRKVGDMTERQLRDWIDACEHMEQWTHAQRKARRDWRAGRAEAVAELERRGLTLDQKD
jgi:ribosomal protein L13E